MDFSKPKVIIDQAEYAYLKENTSISYIAEMEAKITLHEAALGAIIAALPERVLQFVTDRFNTAGITYTLKTSGLENDAPTCTLSINPVNHEQAYEDEAVHH